MKLLGLSRRALFRLGPYRERVPDWPSKTIKAGAHWVYHGRTWSLRNDDPSLL